MRANCRWTRVGVVMGGVALAGCLALVSRPSAAQETAAVSDTTPLTLLLVIFPDTTAAQSAMTSLTAGPTAGAAAQADTSAGPPPNTVGNPADVQWIEPYYAMVSRDKNGKVTAQHYGEKGTTARDTRAENSIDGVVALLGERSNKSDKNGEPVSGAGATRAGISSANMSEMQDMLTPGKTALILVVPHPAVADVTSELKQADASQVYDAPLVVVPAQ
jgi:hypothetical protein